MAMISTTTPAPVSAARPAAAGVMARFGHWLSGRHARAQALRELQSLDERDLRDLRISTYDFDEIASGTFRR